MHLHHKCAAGSGLPVAKAQVQRRAAQLAPQFAPMHHMAADGVRQPQKPRGGFHIARVQGLAHSGAAYAQVLHGVALHICHFKTMRRAQAGKLLIVALALRPKAKIIARQHIPRTQALHQHLLHKLLC